MNEKKELTSKPKLSGTAQQQLDEAEKQFEAFNDNVKELTMDRMNLAPKQETEPQVKKSDRELQNAKDIYLKPHTSISSPQKFNERFRAAYEFDKEYVQFVAENNEIIGETIEIWTRPYGGMNAEFWKVPVNKPIWGPRYLAEQIKRKCYHRLVMQQSVHTGSDGAGQYHGSMVADTTIARLDARPVSTRKSIFFGAQGF